MTGTSLRYFIAFVLIVHGIGHIEGVLAALGIFSTESWHGRSWLISEWLGDGATRIICLLIWFIGFAGFVTAGLSLLDWLVPHGWWRTLAILFAVISLLSIIVYWNSLAAIFNKVGVIGVDLAVLIGLLALNRPSESKIGF